MATPSSTQQAAIANLYIALFNRAPDASGFAFWTEALANGASIDVIAQSFVQTPEAQAIYPVSQTAAQFVTAYYTNVLGRPIDNSGLAFWTEILEASGGVGSNLARALVVSKIVDVVNTPLPVKPADLTDAAYALTFADRNAFKNKGEIAIFYATEYKGTDLNLAKQVLSVVGPASTTIDAAKALLNPPTGGGAPTPPIESNLGFIGTTGNDDFVGKSGNDKFVFVIDNDAPANTTLSVHDKIIGAAGKDTLSVTTTGTVVDADFAFASMTEIETVRINRTDASAVTYDAIADVKDVSVENGAGAISINGLVQDAKLSLKGTSGGQVSLGYRPTATATTIALEGGVNGNKVQLGAPALTSLTLTSSGSANALDQFTTSQQITALTIVANTALTLNGLQASNAGAAVAISGGAAVDLGMLSGSSMKAIDASQNSGGLTATLNSNDVTIEITGSSGKNVITTDTAFTSGFVHAGAGTGDRLIVTNGAAVANRTLGAKYTGFEILQVADGATVDLTNLIGITSVEIAGGAGTTTVAAATTAQAAAMTILSADSHGGINLIAAGAIDTIKATVVTQVGGLAQAIDLTGLTLSDNVTKLELTGNVAAGTSTGLVTLTTANATKLDSIIVKNAGGAAITIGAGHTASNLVIDVSESSGPVTVNAAAYFTNTGVIIKSGSAGATLAGSTKADVITGGIGADSVSGGTGNDTLVGGAGSDTLLGGAGDDYLLGDGALSGVNTAAVHTLRMSGTALNSGTYTLGNSFVDVTAGQDASVVVDAFAGAGKATFLAQNSSVENITYTGDTFTITYKAVLADVPLILVNDPGDISFNILNQPIEAVRGRAGLIAATATTADTLDGGAGRDTFAFAQKSSGWAGFDTIVGLDLGSDVANGRADTLVFHNPDGVAYVSELSSVQLEDIEHQSDLNNAVQYATDVINSDGATGLFTYKGTTYILHNGHGDSTFNDSTDFLIKVTGVAGTLDLSDIVLV